MGMTAVRYTHFNDAAGRHRSRGRPRHRRPRRSSRRPWGSRDVSRSAPHVVVRVTTDAGGDDDAGRPMAAVASGGTGSRVRADVADADAGGACGGLSPTRPSVPGLPGGEPRHGLSVPDGRGRAARRGRLLPGDVPVRAARLSARDHGERLDRWILRIASRKAIDHHRARGRRAIPTAEPPERTAPAVDRRPTTSCGRPSRAAASPAGRGGPPARARPAVRRDRGADGYERRDRPGERVPGHQEAEGADPMNTERSEASGRQGRRGDPIAHRRGRAARCGRGRRLARRRRRRR